MTGIIAFLGFGLCLSCLSAMEQRLGLIGKEGRLIPAQPPVSIPRIGENLSGFTWNQATGTLFAVTNSSQGIHELTPEGRRLRSIRLDGFSDTEDSAHMGGDLFDQSTRTLLTIRELPPYELVSVSLNEKGEPRSIHRPPHVPERERHCRPGPRRDRKPVDTERGVPLPDPPG
jgi:hypothetical protein